MEVIVDELQKNGIRIDMTTLSIHVNRILDIYKAMYDEATNRLKADQLADVFMKTVLIPWGVLWVT